MGKGFFYYEHEDVDRKVWDRLRSSHVYGLACAVRRFFLSSRLNNILESKDPLLGHIASNSYVVTYMGRFFSSSAQHAKEALKTSRILLLVQKALKALKLSHLNALGIMIAAAVITEVAVSLLAKKPADFFSWMIRIMLLSTSAIMIFSRARIEDVLDDSVAAGIFIRK